MAAPVAPVTVEAPVIAERIPPANPPANVTLSPGLAEVVKLAQAGVGEEVIFAYVDKSVSPFQLGADQILYLKDLGVSENVITSMLKHDSSAALAAPAAPASPLVQTQVVSNVSQPLPVNPAPPALSATVTAPAPAMSAPPPSAPEVTQFYDALSPYGSWVYLSTYGWCWQPTVAVSAPAWRPYCDNGRWYWSDNGWYWNSDYSWGWAAFHYGRWYNNPACGWVWAPGLAWGPSWVSWRSQGGYYGWAPLPPEACYVGGVGFTYYGSRVSVGFEFGLGAFSYTFVSAGNFCNYNPYRYCVPRAQVQTVYNNTVVVNNYASGNNTVVNHGMGRQTVAGTSTTPIREVAVREAPGRGVAGVRGDHIEKQGGQSVVYRPQLPKTPPAITTASFANRPGAQSVAPAGGNHSTTMGRVPSGASVATTRPTANATPALSGQPPQNNSVVNRAGQEPRNVSRVQPQANPAPQAQPRPQTQPVQPRAGNSLFGATVANNTPAPNRSTVNSSPGQRVYPQTQTIVPQPSVVAPQNHNSGNMSPRQYETAPRAAAPNQNANYNAQVRSVPQQNIPRQSAQQQTAPQQVAPQRSAPSGGNGNAPSAPRVAPSGGGVRSGGGNGGSQNPRGQ